MMGGRLKELCTGSLKKTLSSEGKKNQHFQFMVCVFFSVEVRMYDRLFTTPNPDDVPEGTTWKDFVNPKSLEVGRTDAIVVDCFSWLFQVFPGIG